MLDATPDDAIEQRDLYDRPPSVLQRCRPPLRLPASPRSNPAKFAAALELGGAERVVCVNPADPVHEGKPVAQLLVDATKTPADAFGGVDYSFECVGSTALMRAALECTHRGWGTSVIIGVAAAGQEVATRPFQLVTGRTWKGTAFGGVKGKSALPGYVEDYLGGRLPLDRFVTHTFDGVARINDAMHLMHDPAGNCLRPVISLGGGGGAAGQ